MKLKFKSLQSRIARGLYWDRALTLVQGCTPVSAGCAHCWAARATRMREKNPNAKIRAANEGLTTEMGVFNGRVRFMSENLLKPLTVGIPQVWAVWNDLFHQGVTDRQIVDTMKIIGNNQCHYFLILTKRPERLRELDELRLWPHNVALGVTVENADYLGRIDDLTETPAEIRYVSVEPMLGPVVLGERLKKLDWVICGAETGGGKRFMDPAWAEDLLEECRAYKVPFFFKKDSDGQPYVKGEIVREFPVKEEERP